MNTMNKEFPILQGSQEAFGSYLHQLSHDLRTPLNHINGFAELLLLDDELGPVNAQYAEAILAGCDALKTAAIGHIQFMEAVMTAIQVSTEVELQQLREMQMRPAA